jgi:5-carboxymethyl-2-hydroxymuconate isomerase
MLNVGRALSISAPAPEDAMPHVIVEYSANLEQHVDPQALVDDIHAAVMPLKLADVAALRVRAAPRPYWRIADGNPDNMFIAATARLRVGRSVEQRETLGKVILAAIEQRLGAVLDREAVGITVEIHEIDQMTFRRNTIRDRLKEKA